MKKFISLIVLIYSVTLKADPIVNNFRDNFVLNIPQEWAIEEGSWHYFDVVNCFTQGATCFGNNPTSPYGFPVFRYDHQGNPLLDFKLKPNDAIVLFFRLPPKMRYFGFTQYLFSRSGFEAPVFASLSDTFNNTEERFETTIRSIDGSYGPQLFDKYAAIVWTADKNTFNQVAKQLKLQGIEQENINFIKMPYQLPVYLGENESADTFAMLMRTALPEVQLNFEAYKEEKPFYVVKVGPTELQTVAPTEIIGYRDEASGNIEDPTYKVNLDKLVQDIARNYSDRFNFKEQRVAYRENLGWDCITGESVCNGDNHDARYSTDLTIPFKPKNLSDAILIVGVNHQLTGKAVYQNHSVYELEKFAGIVSVDDRSMTLSSALYHAGFFREAKRLEYKNLYAYLISYDCNGIKFCVTIPAPTDDNPVGLEPGTPFYLIGRSYVEPSTGVRPAIDELIKHRTFIL
jgi:hypothetical protein